jgi:membrane protease YdiL (CAAX protease family)
MNPFPIEQQFPFWSWKDMLYIVAVAVPMCIVAASASAFLLHVLPGDEPKAVQLLVPQFAAFAAALIPLAFVFRVRYDKPLWSSVRFGVPPGEWHRSLAGGLGLAIAVLALGMLLQPPKIHSPLQDLMDDPASAPFLAVAAVTAGPIFEELFFRGLLQPLLVRDTGVIAGVFLSSLPFALLHGPEYGWSWRHVSLILLAGIGFGWKRFRTNSTGAATIMHAAYNAVLTTGYIFGKNVIDA